MENKIESQIERLKIQNKLQKILERQAREKLKYPNLQETHVNEINDFKDNTKNEIENFIEQRQTDMFNETYKPDENQTTEEIDYKPLKGRARINALNKNLINLDIILKQSSPEDLEIVDEQGKTIGQIIEEKVQEYKSNYPKSNTTFNGICGICKQKINGDWCQSCPAGHIFHCSCIKQFTDITNHSKDDIKLENNRTLLTYAYCPVCNAVIIDEPEIITELPQQKKSLINSFFNLFRRNGFGDLEKIRGIKADIAFLKKL